MLVCCVALLFVDVVFVWAFVEVLCVVCFFCCVFFCVVLLSAVWVCCVLCDSVLVLFV